MVVVRPDPPAYLRTEWDSKLYPVEAVNALAKGGQPIRVFSTDDWGAYLTFRLYPEWRVFIDGRADFYGPKFSRQFRDVLTARAGWEQTLERYGVQAVLLPLKVSLVSTLKLSPQWEVVYSDRTAILFRQRGTDAPLAGATVCNRNLLSVSTPQRSLLGPARQTANRNLPGGDSL
jgi:hypothetical protein